MSEAENVLYQACANYAAAKSEANKTAVVRAVLDLPLHDSAWGCINSPVSVIVSASWGEYIRACNECNAIPDNFSDCGEMLPDCGADYVGKWSGARSSSQ